MDEYDSTKDMQEYARIRWVERAKKLGIITEDDAKKQDIAASRKNMILTSNTGTAPSPTTTEEKKKIE